MIRQREFNMAELEYFIDPNVDATHDLSKWNGIDFQLIPDPENGEQKTINLDIGTALTKNIVRHPTVAMFMAETFDFLTNIGADPAKIRFRQHESDEMAHYASDCWDLEMHGSYGWIECVGIAHRGCYDLGAHEEATGTKELRAWRDFDEPIEVDKEVVSAIGSVVGPAFRQQAGQVTEALSKLETIPTTSPFELTLNDGNVVTIDDSMVEIVRIQETIRGEWFLPHVVEPAFGLDRIIWHLLDHGYEMTSKEGEEYLILHLSESVAPYEVVVLPLFEKDGMEEIGKELQSKLLEINGIGAYYDGTRSIGRRYARADEIGVPWAVTVDYESLEDGTVTVRRRDDQSQIRISTDDLIRHLQNGSLASVF